MNNILLVGVGVALGLYIAKRRCGCHKPAGGGSLITSLPPAPADGGLDDGQGGAATLGAGSGASPNSPIDIGAMSGASCGGYATAAPSRSTSTGFAGGLSL
jgi:hypothetical protein